MKKILLIQSRERPDMLKAEQENYTRAVGERVELSFLSILDERLAWADPVDFLKGYDGVIFGGSAEFDIHGGRGDDDPMRLTAMIILLRMRTLISYLEREKIPVLGVCFGHQLIAQIYDGHVTNDSAQKKVGSFEVELTEEGKKDPLFGALPHSFMAQYGHKDSVTSLPKDAVLLAAASACHFSALRYGSNIYTMQFHPELRPEDEIAALKRGKDYLPRGTLPESIVQESPEASRIIALWIEKIVAS